MATAMSSSRSTAAAPSSSLSSATATATSSSSLSAAALSSSDLAKIADEVVLLVSLPLRLSPAHRGGIIVKERKGEREE